jgi:hypothetical protein
MCMLSRSSGDASGRDRGRTFDILVVQGCCQDVKEVVGVATTRHDHVNFFSPSASEGIAVPLIGLIGKRKEARALANLRISRPVRTRARVAHGTNCLSNDALELKGLGTHIAFLILSQKKAVSRGLLSLPRQRVCFI